MNRILLLVTFCLGLLFTAESVSGACTSTLNSQRTANYEEELQSLDDAGVVAIDLEFRYSRRQDQYGNELRYIGKAWILKGGKVKKTATTDVFFFSYE